MKKKLVNFVVLFLGSSDPKLSVKIGSCVLFVKNGFMTVVRRLMAF